MRVRRWFAAALLALSALAGARAQCAATHPTTVGSDRAAWSALEVVSDGGMGGMDDPDNHLLYFRSADGTCARIAANARPRKTKKKKEKQKKNKKMRDEI